MRALLAPVNREIPAFAGMERGAGMEREAGMGMGSGDENRERKMGAEIKKKVVAGV